MSGTLRITGGRLVRRRFAVPKEADENIIRPATDMIREAIFSSLGEKIHHASVLDLFGGSGAYSFEALSRWAKEATLIEMNRNILDCIRQSAEKLGISKHCNLVHQDSEKWVNAASGKYDFIFLDPPFKMTLSQNYWEQVYKLLSEDGTVIFRCHKKSDTEIPEFFTPIREKVYGSSLVIFLAAA